MIQSDHTRQTRSQLAIATIIYGCKCVHKLEGLEVTRTGYYIAFSPVIKGVLYLNEKGLACHGLRGKQIFEY
jgi:hypothetical protein